MKISTKGRYAVRVMLDLALQPLGLGSHLNGLSSICRVQGIEIVLDALLQLSLATLNHNSQYLTPTSGEKSGNAAQTGLL